MTDVRTCHLMTNLDLRGVVCRDRSSRCFFDEWGGPMFRICEDAKGGRDQSQVKIKGSVYVFVKTCKVILWFPINGVA